MQSLQATVCISQLEYKYGISPKNSKLACLRWVALSVLSAVMLLGTRPASLTH